MTISTQNLNIQQNMTEPLIPPELSKDINIINTIKNAISYAEHTTKQAEPILQKLKQKIIQALKKSVSDDPEERREVIHLIQDIQTITERLYDSYIPKNILYPEPPMAIDFLIFRVNKGIYKTAPRIINITPTNIILKMGWRTDSLLKTPSTSILLTLIYYIDKIYETYTKLFDKELKRRIKNKIKISKLVETLEKKIEETLRPLGKNLQDYA